MCGTSTSLVTVADGLDTTVHNGDAVQACISMRRKIRQFNSGKEEHAKLAENLEETRAKHHADRAQRNDRISALEATLLQEKDRQCTEWCRLARCDALPPALSAWTARVPPDLQNRAETAARASISLFQPRPRKSPK